MRVQAEQDFTAAGSPLAVGFADLVYEPTLDQLAGDSRHRCRAKARDLRDSFARERTLPPNELQDQVLVALFHQSTIAFKHIAHVPAICFIY
jgi:hypothetical protein